MKNILSLFLLFSAASISRAEPLSAIMTFESMAITAEGVRKQTQFQERFIRDTNVIWSERIVPRSAQHHSQHDTPEHAHHDLNFATAGKWISRTADDQINFAFVREQDKKIIQPRPSEYGMLGFNGDWESAYYLIDRAALKKMETKTGPSEATLWYEKKDATQLTRVLWDARRQIPLSIETTKLDGTMSNKITLSIAALPAVLPWNNLKAYQLQAYEDLLD